MLHTSYTWRPLGELLVENGSLEPADLETALAEQKRTGRLVGEILVESGYISAFTLTRAIAAQHGVDLQPAVSTEASSAATPPATAPPPAWRPLGKLLVESEFLTKAQLEEALAEQRKSGGRRLLGEILVASGVMSGASLAHALAEQQGLELESEATNTDMVLKSSAHGQAVYEVYEVVYEPRYQIQRVLYESPSFLEAADYAAEFVEDHNPTGVEIHRDDSGARETVWTYSQSRASALAGTQKPLAETFGFDPTLWGTTR